MVCTCSPNQNFNLQNIVCKPGNWWQAEWVWERKRWMQALGFVMIKLLGYYIWTDLKRQRCSLVREQQGKKNMKNTYKLLQLHSVCVRQKRYKKRTVSWKPKVEEEVKKDSTSNKDDNQEQSCGKAERHPGRVRQWTDIMGERQPQ